MNKSKKRVSFSNFNQVITIDEIDKIMTKQNYISIPIKQNNFDIIKNGKNQLFFKNIVLGIVIFLFSLILFFQLKNSN